MAYYTALINAWNSVTQPPAGVTGTGLSGGMTTAQKIAAVNGWTITGSAPSQFYLSGAQILNCINWAEFAALTAQQQSNILALCQIPGGLLGGSAETSFVVDGMFIAYFNPSGPSLTALTAMASAQVQSWWQANGYASQINANDLVAAGGLT